MNTLVYEASDAIEIPVPTDLSDTSEYTPSSVPWGHGIAVERLTIIEEFEAATQRCLRARVGLPYTISRVASEDILGNPIEYSVATTKASPATEQEAEDADRHQLTVIGAAAIHRAAIVNDVLAGLRMAFEDDPGSMTTYIRPLVAHVIAGYERRIELLEQALGKVQRDVEELEHRMVDLLASTV